MHKKNRRASARSRYMVAARVLQSVVAIAMIRNGLLGQIWRFYSSQKTGSNVKTAIVMMNMGGPQHVSEVYEYLLKIMTDRNMIQFPFFQEYAFFDNKFFKLLDINNLTCYTGI